MDDLKEEKVYNDIMIQDEDSPIDNSISSPKD